MTRTPGDIRVQPSLIRLRRSAWIHLLLLSLAVFLAFLEVFHSALHHHPARTGATHAAGLCRRGLATAGGGHAMFAPENCAGEPVHHHSDCPLCNGTLVCNVFAPPEFSFELPSGVCDPRPPEALHILKLLRASGRDPPRV